MGEQRFTEEEHQRIVIPLAKHLVKLHREGKTFIVGIQGGQGTGKTTIVQFLERDLQRLGYTVTSFSIDDFYHTWRKRKQLQRQYPDNPFYQISRGMPGTHRTTELRSVLQKARAGKPFEIPQFDKSSHHAAGDVLPQTIKVAERQDFIILEGWCVGLPLVSSQELLRICQKYDIKLQTIDPDLKHHKVLLQYIKQYTPIWKTFDFMIMLKPFSPVLHFRWRWKQERLLKQKTGKGMSRDQVDRFVTMYLPLTYVCYDKIKADKIIYINERHEFFNRK